MAKTSDYRIVTFQRQPGLWRANMTPIVPPATLTRGAALRGFVTAEDRKSEEDAVIAANRAIRDLDASGADEFWLSRSSRARLTSPRRGEVDLRSKSGEVALFQRETVTPHPRLRRDLSRWERWTSRCRSSSA
jgi:hypothetical protein